MSKTDEIKNKIRQRDARSSLMGSTSETAKKQINQNKENIEKSEPKKTENVLVEKTNMNDDITKERSQATNVENENNTFLNNLIQGKGKKKNDALINTGIYFEPEVVEILNKLGKQGGRGAKSKIVNDAVKAVFKEAGLIK
ncbi:hypothetical protein I6J18_00070 (plasmid) [Peribacillus psychrosaccharolyticus]|uniref:Uncharacterized protein n=1 Tax=Peribacillus psychrosaccharolyticus TaxID=1407 RepID=A0A974NIM0_PERPY|nr:hypothetical protein [Peribacillus psychrosaccharolyticus]MEC2054201.1 hypothetical protein [Peribacillus psychrosaccharolyticus]MED3746552.1 hypothetical protein [Peribacillus psychrosaccharolyticus]QQS98440.1 hypothetical protein I6J18_00070 [Peribacillus psychrosaccharolyticus]